MRDINIATHNKTLLAHIMADDEQPQPKMQWVVNINKDLENLPNTSAESAHWSKRSIYRIPASVTDVNTRAYKPQIVSFGPYHHGSVHLRAMEEHKRRALLHFLKRSGRPLQTYVDALFPVAQDLKDAYDQLGAEWHDDTAKFLELMIVDGCFMLEILRVACATDAGGSGAHQLPPPPPSGIQHASQPGPRAPAPVRGQQAVEPPAVVKDYAENDPIFSKHGKLYIVPYLKRDMLMLENQLPMMVLEKLVAVQNDKSLKDSKDLTKRILKFFQQNINHANLHEFNHCLHILDIYRRSLLLEEPRAKKQKARAAAPAHQGGDDIIRSATELNEAGIRIKRSKSRSLKDISFRGGVLRLPLIVVDDALESLYLNLIAFERFHVGAGNDLTSYIFFMDNIIDSAMDVSLLHSCGIIQNALGSDKAVAKLFNSLSKDITLDPESSLEQVHKQVSEYCQKPWHQWRANLMHTYFTNPWAILSVIAAIFLFALTIVQTIYGVLSYINPPA
ncbi:hypothetical protein SASPL_119047 [Salvia splendens]|uniref:Uncharacterized protein n=1 Tax=Salvia splendens TaxID=180675 RepID=A0A8X8XXV1_SALSN|nr:UPF0481 protein At3g47200-like [Salvia splendens]KAG6422475.1 hypothetical protein SASPL_119047 [Salvia splendens]